MKKWIEPRAVRDIMVPSPVTVRPDTSLPDLKALFERYDVNAFPVVDERGVLRGIVSRLDVLRVFRPDKRRWISSLLALWAERVDEIMSRGIIAVEPDESVVAALDVMIEAGRRSLPVVERRAVGPVLVGMISRTDLLQRLTLTAEEPPGGGGSHMPGSASPSRLHRHLDRFLVHHRVLKGLVTRGGKVLRALISNALTPRSWRRREEPDMGSAGEVPVKGDPMASVGEPWARQRDSAEQEAAAYAD
jgi:CBS domain-containing protein